MKYFIAIILLFSSHLLCAQYTIEGQVNLGTDWQPKIFMASVNKLSDYYRTSPDMIVNTAAIDSSGYFVLSGDNLPDEQRFYRLYLMKKQNTDYDACLYVGGDDHNFVHIVLKNGESVKIISDLSLAAPFGKYQVQGQSANQLMQNLANIVFPSFYFYRIKFPTELKFSEQKLHTNLKNFADSCSNTLVALAAINNTDFDEYFDRDIDFYQNFGARLKVDLPHSIYTKNYLLKLKYYKNEDSSFSIGSMLVIGLLSLLCISLLFLLKNYRQQIHLLQNQLQAKQQKTVPKKLSLDRLLTQKEKEILQLIGEGKSNKEIASAQFVELSTVKTHINKIYAKMKVSNRKEAQRIAKEILTKS